MGSNVGRAGTLLGADSGSGIALDGCAMSESVRVETRRKQVRTRRWEVGLEWSNMATMSYAVKRSSWLLIEVRQDVSMVAKVIDQRPK